MVGLVLVGGFSLVHARATLNGACDAPIDGHQCLDMTGVSETERNSPARHCQSGHCVGLGVNVLCCLPPPAAGAPTPVSDACGAAITAMGTRPAALVGVQASWTCRIPPPGAPIPSGTCADYAPCQALNPTAKCCQPDYGALPGRPPVTGTGTTAPTGAAPSRGLAGRLGLPDCATTHDPLTAGKCTLDDIKTVAVNFANFLMGLAAAFFLAIFVWAGFRYIFFAYDSGVAGEARKTLTNAAIGMLLVLGAATIVRFTQTAVTGRVPTEDRCVAQKTAAYSCQNTTGMPTDRRRNCVDLLCPGAAAIKCCPVPPPAAGTAPAATTPGAPATPPAPTPAARP